MYLEIPQQPGLEFFKLGFAKIFNRDGRKNLRRTSTFVEKLPFLQLLMALLHFRHACLELAKITSLKELLSDWATQKGEKSVQQHAIMVLQRIHTCSKLLRGSGDGGHNQTVQRILMTRCAPIAAELHALRTNKAKFPPQAFDSAIVMTDGSPSKDGAGRGSSGPKQGRMPPHLQPVPLTYGIGTRSILQPAAKSFLALRHGAAPMVLAPPRRPYTSLIDPFPSNSQVCTFDRVRI